MSNIEEASFVGGENGGETFIFAGGGGGGGVLFREEENLAWVGGERGYPST